MSDIWAGAAKRLDDIDLPTIGQLIRVGEDEIHAILDVESAGRGFDEQGRVRILFEPHKFYSLLTKAKFILQRNKAVAAGVAYEKWNSRNYKTPAYDRLAKAVAINSNLALQSASWGLGQVMGFNHKLAGFPTVEAMVASFAADEENQLRGMINFINATGLADKLRNHDWRGFEDGYNGGGFNGAYAKKLKAAYERWQAIKDTPLQTAANAPPVPKTDLPPVPAPVQAQAPAMPASAPPRGFSAWLASWFRK